MVPDVLCASAYVWLLHFCYSLHVNFGLVLYVVACLYVRTCIESFIPLQSPLKLDWLTQSILRSEYRRVLYTETIPHFIEPVFSTLSVGGPSLHLFSNPNSNIKFDPPPPMYRWEEWTLTQGWDCSLQLWITLWLEVLPPHTSHFLSHLAMILFDLISCIIIIPWLSDIDGDLREAVGWITPSPHGKLGPLVLEVSHSVICFIKYGGLNLKCTGDFLF